MVCLSVPGNDESSPGLEKETDLLEKVNKERSLTIPLFFSSLKTDFRKKLKLKQIKNTQTSRKKTANFNYLAWHS